MHLRKLRIIVDWRITNLTLIVKSRDDCLNYAAIARRRKQYCFSCDWTGQP